MSEWLAWWEAQLGPDWFKKRGRQRGQYCMTRFNDEGPYASWNVECKTNGKNSKETDYSIKSGCFLDKETILEIFNASGKHRDIAKKFGTNNATVSRIKRGLSYNNVTAGK